MELFFVAVKLSIERFFIMPAANINNVKSGLCPHGMSPGACPICSGMGGGGGSRVGERPQKAGEWSYHHCAMVGAMMKARAQRIETHEKNLLAHAEALLKFQQNLEKMAQKMIDFANQISKSFILKPVAFTIKNIVVPIINTIRNIPNIISNLNQIKQRFVDIQDKLNALFGEAKAFVEKKISEFISSVKSKFEDIFKIFKKNNTEDDDTKIDDDKKIFNLKKVLRKLWKKRDDTEDRSGS